MTALNNLAAADQAVIGGIATSNGAAKTDLSNATGFVDTSTTQDIAGVKTFTGQLIGKGTATNDSAAAGYIGEYGESVIAQGSAIALVSGTPKTITSVSLTAGEYDVWGSFGGIPSGVSAFSTLGGGISTTTNTLPSAGDSSRFFLAASLNASVPQEMTVGQKRVSLASTTTVYLVGRADFTVGTMGGYGTLAWRRVR